MPTLLHPRIVREHLAGLVLPTDIEPRREVVHGWVKLLKSGRLAEAKERHLQGEFLTRIFGTVLGYRTQTTAADSHTWELGAEFSLGRSGKTADGAIGYFGPNLKHLVAPIELKGADQHLDVRKGRDRTPVEQAWEYASLAPESRWVLVSNYAETRLYARSRGWDAYEVFRLEELDSDDGFLRFYGLLSRPTLLGPEPGAAGPLDNLLEAGLAAQQRVTEKLYATYREIRRELFVHLNRRHSNRRPVDLLPLAQTILDRILFCAFAEDRLLIPPGTIMKALEARNAYDANWSKWRALCAVFSGVDKGNHLLGLPPLNGGLFRQSEEIEELEIADEVCDRFREIASYDFAEDVSVEVLGHIFEQSVSDLEEIRAETTNEDFDDTQRAPSKRRAEGVFYTPNFITRYLVDLTLGLTFREKEEAAFASVYLPGVRRSADRDLQAWEKYREALRSLRILDPACGSGAFLIAAFEALEREYDRVNRALAGLRKGQIDAFDLTSSVLNENLFGLDLNGESVEITKLSLWLKTARRDKQLTYLDRNIRRGNSVVDDPMMDPFAFDWRAGRTAQTVLEEASDENLAASIDARWRDGFDVVLGNPPYVRHELLTKFKPHWQQRFDCYDGSADLFVYFFERAIAELKPGGRLGFIVSNKWLRAGYANELRRFLSSRTVVERIIDFGHAPIFPDADAFPCIITLRKLADGELVPEDHQTSVTKFPRENLKKADIPTYVAANEVPIPQKELSAASWILLEPREKALFDKMRERGIPLKDFAKCVPLDGVKTGVEAEGFAPLYGLKTGLNAAFVVDTATRDRLIAADPNCAPLLKKYVRGQDVARWRPDWAGQWLIELASSGDREWPWARQSETTAERTFQAKYPALHRHMKQFEEKLRNRSDQGRFWWELRACAYYDKFSAPKIIYPDLLWRADFALDSDGALATNTTYLLPTGNKWLLAVLNSPLMWTYLWNHAQHGKDETLRMFGDFVQTLPIAAPNPRQLTEAERIVDELVAGKERTSSVRAAVLDVLRMQYGVESPGNALTDLYGLSEDDFVREVLRRRPRRLPRLSVAAQSDLRSIFTTEVAPMVALISTMKARERELSSIVCNAYGINATEERLMWDAAPPRMPEIAAA